MRLWSYHSPDFSLVDGKIDPEKSDHARRYRKAYEELWRRLGTSQFIWCVTSKEGWPRKEGFCEWELEVPKTAFFQIVDSMVWAGIRGENPDPPIPLRQSLKVVSLQRPAGWYEQQVSQMLHPPGDPWESLFLASADDPRADVLLRHPVERSWVKS
jgi:hypothetical protein